MGNQCPKCGRPLGAGETEGLCARCLLALALRPAAGKVEIGVPPRRPEWMLPDRSTPRSGQNRRGLPRRAEEAHQDEEPATPGCAADGVTRDP